MCGITGQLNFKTPVEENNIRLMNEAIRHRGPDGEGVYLNQAKSIGLGHRRLSFLDLTEAGKQPMCNENGGLWITYNGEVYNYIELRNELEKLGHRFYSHSDTEVILHGYEEWGAEVLGKIKGMFAFAIWHEQKQELFIARDRFGIKPLYYYYENRNFVFASEIKGIKANAVVSTTLDYASFADFFVYRYVPSPKTIWNEVKKLPAAHFLLLKADGSVTIKKYWDIPYGEKVIPDKEAIEKFDELLAVSVKMHARSDVAVGSLLSGGYDSSALVYYMSRFGYTPATFSLGFENWEVSEHLFADIVAKQYHTKHHSIVLGPQSLNVLNDLAWVYDEPNGDISIIPTYLVTKEASKNAKAVMSGEGADEILVGYQWQKDFVSAPKTWSSKLQQLFNPDYVPPVLQHYSRYMSMGKFDAAELKKLLHPDLHKYIKSNADWWYNKLYNSALPELKAMQVLDIKHFMGEQVLAKVDRASMANSLEVRVPFLDHEICEFVLGLSPSVYYRPNETKHLLYQNIKNHFPPEILNRTKQGFVGPDNYYMNIDWYKNQLNNSQLVKHQLINESYVNELLTNKDYWRLWKVAVMETWYRQWM